RSGDAIDVAAPRHELRQDVGGVRHESDGPYGALAPVALDSRERFVERRSDLVEKALRLAALGPRWIDLDHERDALVHCDGHRLRAAHASEPRRDNEAASK